MKNSWGQEIEVGSVVYRGARLRNGSEYKVGTVESLKPGKPPRVKWMFESSIQWIRVDGQQVCVPSVYKLRRPSSGSPSVDSLVVVDFDIEELNRKSEFFNSIDRDSNFRSLEEFQDALTNFIV